LVRHYNLLIYRCFDAGPRPLLRRTKKSLTGRFPVPILRLCGAAKRPGLAGTSGNVSGSGRGSQGAEGGAEDGPIWTNADNP